MAASKRIGEIGPQLIGFQCVDGKVPYQALIHGLYIFSLCVPLIRRDFPVQHLSKWCLNYELKDAKILYSIQHLNKWEICDLLLKNRLKLDGFFMFRRRLTEAFSSAIIWPFIQKNMRQKEKEKLGAYAMKCVAAGTYLPTPWLFQPVKRPDDRADYCLGCSCLP